MNKYETEKGGETNGMRFLLDKVLEEKQRKFLF